MKYIGVGNWSKYYKYILLAFISELLMNLLFGLNSSNKDKPARIFPFRSKIKDHKLLSNFIQFASILFGGIILYFTEGLNVKKNDEVTIEEYEKTKDYLFENKRSSITFNLIIISVLFSLYIILKDFIDLSQMTFWALEILYIALISYRIFKNKIYIHKKIAIYIMFIATVIDIIENFLPNTKHKNLKNGNELTDKNAFETAIIKYGAYSIPLYYIANELHHIQRDYCWIKAKYLMDIKSLQAYKLFLTISGFGFIFVIIFFSIFTYVPCKTFNNINEIDGNYFYNNTSEKVKLYLEYCSLKDYDENRNIFSYSFIFFILFS